MKITTIILLLMGLFLISNANAYEFECRHHCYPDTQPTETEKEIVIADDAFKSAMATTNAMGGHQFSYGIHGWQGALSLGGYAGKIAIAGGVAKRYNGVLYNVSAGKRSFNATANWTF